jgi:Uma2 family endonuclease
MMLSALCAIPKEESMTSSTIATWAEPVRWTADDLLRLSDAGFHFELVQGELVRMAPTGGSHGLRTGRLHGVLSAYVGTNGLGEIAAAETGFDLTQPGDAAQTVLAPDIAFVRSENVPLLDVEGYPRVVPDLVVETASPNPSRDGLAGKARAWLQTGVRLVWVVWPKQRVVDVWLPGNERPHATLDVDGTLDGGEVVPGFRYPVAALFR